VTFALRAAARLHRHVAQSAETDDADTLSCNDLPVLHRRERGDPGAEQRRSRREVYAGWDADDEALGHDQLIGVAAEGVATRLIGRVVGKGGPLDAVLFAISQTVLAGPAGVDHAAHAADVTDPELGHRASHGLHATDDLVARDARISSPVPRRPFIARLMDVGMADAAIQHVEQDVVGSDGAAFNLQRHQGACGVRGAIGAGSERAGVRGRFWSSQRGRVCPCEQRCDRKARSRHQDLTPSGQVGTPRMVDFWIPHGIDS